MLRLRILSWCAYYVCDSCAAHPGCICFGFVLDCRRNRVVFIFYFWLLKKKKIGEINGYSFVLDCRRNWVVSIGGVLIMYYDLSLLCLFTKIQKILT